MRLDLWLVQNKLALSRTQAQELIKNGFILINKKVVLKSSFEVSDQSVVSVEDNKFQKYVSRAGLKLESALDFLNLDVEGKIVLDVGQSTGGFSDCLRQRKAQLIVGVDVGTSQLHPSLKNVDHIISIENLNVKNLADDLRFRKTVPANGFDLLVMDISFISITKVMKHMRSYLKMGSDYLFLVKPQFELSPNALDKNGIVKDEKFYSVVQNNVMSEAQNVFGSVTQYFKSALDGKDGNQEFFIYGHKKID